MTTQTNTPKPAAKPAAMPAASGCTPSFTHGGILYTISRHKLGMTHETASRFVEACVRFATDDTDRAPEAA